MPDKDDQLERIQRLIEIMKANGLVEIEIRQADEKISLRRYEPQRGAREGLTVVPPVGSDAGAGLAGPEIAGTAADQAGTGEELVEIRSPLVGTFYATPSPDSEPYVEVGSQVEPQTVVCIIEAMKVMNEIKAETRGTIAEVLVSNGQAVEYGQVLFRVRPES